MTFIPPPVGLILANNGVSPWKEHYYGSSSSSSSSSSWSSYSHDDNIDESYLSDKELIDAVKNYYPYIKDVEIKKYDEYRRVKCYFDNDFLEKVYFTVYDTAINHPDSEISMGDLFDDNRWCSEIYESRRDFLEKVDFALHTHSEVMYYVTNKKGEIVTPYYANKKLAEEWISKQPTTEKWLWFELKNDNFEIKRKTIYVKDEK